MTQWVNLHAPARTAAGLANAAALIGCDAASLSAVLAVEAGKTGFDHKGRLKALFEPHIFHRVLSKSRPAALEAATAEGLAYPRWGEQPYPADSYPRILAAAAIDPELARQSTSWGLPQILGLNHELAGYPDAAAMVTAFLISEDEQIAAMARFIGGAKLAGALRRHDWAAFARGYNGAGYARNAYDIKLAAAYARAQSAPRISPTAPEVVTKSVVIVASSAAAGASLWAYLAGSHASMIPVLGGLAMAAAAAAAIAWLIHRLPDIKAPAPDAAPATPAAPPAGPGAPVEPIVADVSSDQKAAPAAPLDLEVKDLLSVLVAKLAERRKAALDAQSAFTAQRDLIQATIVGLGQALEANPPESVEQSTFTALPRSPLPMPEAVAPNPRETENG